MTSTKRAASPVEVEVKRVDVMPAATILHASFYHCKFVSHHSCVLPPVVQDVSEYLPVAGSCGGTRLASYWCGEADAAAAATTPLAGLASNDPLMWGTLLRATTAHMYTGGFVRTSYKVTALGLEGKDPLPRGFTGSTTAAKSNGPCYVLGDDDGVVLAFVWTCNTTGRLRATHRREVDSGDGDDDIEDDPVTVLHTTTTTTTTDTTELALYNPSLWVPDGFPMGSLLSFKASQ